MSWMTYQQTLPDRPTWVVLAVTGVAAANAGGTTVHAFFRLRKNAKSAIYKDTEAQDALRDVQGLLIEICETCVRIEACTNSRTHSRVLMSVYC